METSVDLFHVLFWMNMANKDGGGVWTSTLCSLREVGLLENVAERNGGGIMATQSTNLNMLNCGFSTNNAFFEGGCMYLADFSYVLGQNISLSGCRSTIGGGLKASGVAQFYFIDIDVIDCSASFSGGGALFCIF